MIKRLSNKKIFLTKVFLGAALIAGSFFGSTFSHLQAQEPLLLAQADNTEYKLLAPIPYVDVNAENKTTAVKYIPGAVKLVIILSGVLAIVMIMSGGIQYMSTDAFTGKNEAKKTIQNAFMGLGFVLGAFVILATISPKLLEINITLDRFTPPEIERSTTTPPVERPGNWGPSFGDPWPNDSTERGILMSAGIFINRSNCTSVGQTLCTSVSGLSFMVSNSLLRLKNACGCTLTVTGGTEYWLHGNRSTEINRNGTRHKPNGNAVDLRKDSQLGAFIQSSMIRLRQRHSCNNLGPSYQWGVNGPIFVDEGDHWHVCF